ncbi:hypothetical protein [Streptomyces sp. ALB3]|uniref:hypothetical protein n=1 Tax=Streptomyces sp. ALB3 TaxID=3374278 RepID=UPI0037A5F72B
MTRRPRLSTLLAVVCLLAGGLTFAAPASAAPTGLLDITCTPPSSNSTTFSPPLTNTPALVTRTGSAQFGPCVSLSRPDVTSGSSSRPPTSLLLDCSDLLTASSTTTTITWNTGETSTLSLNSTATIIGAALITTATGTVTAGLFQGDTVVRTTVAPALTVTTCTLGLGNVPSLYALSTLEITSL